VRIDSPVLDRMSTLVLVLEHLLWMQAVSCHLLTF
jgi:hypothetical protein